MSTIGGDAQGRLIGALGKYAVAEHKRGQKSFPRRWLAKSPRAALHNELQKALSTDAKTLALFPKSTPPLRATADLLRNFVQTVPRTNLTPVDVGTINAAINELNNKITTYGKSHPNKTQIEIVPLLGLPEKPQAPPPPPEPPSKPQPATPESTEVEEFTEFRRIIRTQLTLPTQPEPFSAPTTERPLVNAILEGLEAACQALDVSNPEHQRLLQKKTEELARLTDDEVGAACTALENSKRDAERSRVQQEVAALQAQLNTQQMEKQQLDDERKTLDATDQASQQKFDSELQALSETQTTLEKQLTELNDQQLGLVDQIASRAGIEQDIRLAEKSIQSAQKEIEAGKEQIHAFKTDWFVYDRQAKVDKIEGDNETKQQLIETKEAVIADLKKEIARIDDLERENERIKQAMEKTSHAIQEVPIKSERLKENIITEREAYQAKRDDLTLNQSALTSAMEGIRDKIEALEVELARLDLPQPIKPSRELLLNAYLEELLLGKIASSALIEPFVSGQEPPPQPPSETIEETVPTHVLAPEPPQTTTHVTPVEVEKQKAPQEAIQRPVEKPPFIPRSTRRAEKNMQSAENLVTNLAESSAGAYALIPPLFKPLLGKDKKLTEAKLTSAFGPNSNLQKMTRALEKRFHKMEEGDAEKAAKVKKGAPKTEESIDAKQEKRRQRLKMLAHTEIVMAKEFAIIGSSNSSPAERTTVKTWVGNAGSGESTAESLMMGLVHKSADIEESLRTFASMPSYEFIKTLHINPEDIVAFANGEMPSSGFLESLNKEGQEAINAFFNGEKRKNLPTNVGFRKYVYRFFSGIFVLRGEVEEGIIAQQFGRMAIEDILKYRNYVSTLMKAVPATALSFFSGKTPKEVDDAALRGVVRKALNTAVSKLLDHLESSYKRIEPKSKTRLTSGERDTIERVASVLINEFIDSPRFLEIFSLLDSLEQCTEKKLDVTTFVQMIFIPLVQESLTAAKGYVNSCDGAEICRVLNSLCIAPK